MGSVATTLDDLLRGVFGKVIDEGENITTSRGLCREVRGILLELANPRARLSVTEARGKVFSALGELCWYLAGSDDPQFIGYYIPSYKSPLDSPGLADAYGPRLISKHGFNQIIEVVNLLKRKPTSRRAVIQIFEATDLKVADGDDRPCTISIQFMLRNGRLDAYGTMRSNDLCKGFIHDVFAFTMIQELIAASLCVELGTYRHFVGSLHFYERDRAIVDQFLQEGWQTPLTAMPSIPAGDPWGSVDRLLTLEEQIRCGKPIDEMSLDSLDSYWSDLVRLLMAYANRKSISDVRKYRSAVMSQAFEPFLDALEERAVTAPDISKASSREVV